VIAEAREYLESGNETVMVAKYEEYPGYAGLKERQIKWDDISNAVGDIRNRMVMKEIESKGDWNAIGWIMAIGGAWAVWGVWKISSKVVRKKDSHERLII
jgi:hypothetical protein